MSALASQITSLAIAYSTVYSSADQRKHQTPRPWPVNSPHKWPVTWKMFSFDGVIMRSQKHRGVHGHDSNCLFAQRNKCFRHNNFQAWSEDKHIALATFRINDCWNEDVVIFTKKFHHWLYVHGKLQFWHLPIQPKWRHCRFGNGLFGSKKHPN